MKINFFCAIILHSITLTSYSSVSALRVGSSKLGTSEFAQVESRTEVSAEANAEFYNKVAKFVNLAYRKLKPALHKLKPLLKSRNFHYNTENQNGFAGLLH